MREGEEQREGEEGEDCADGAQRREGRGSANGRSRKGSQIIEARIWKEGAGRRGEAKEGGRNGVSEQAAPGANGGGTARRSKGS